MSELTRRINEHIEHTEEVLEKIDEREWNEETTKRLLIQPFLEDVLNWPMDQLSERGRVVSEYTVPQGSTTSYADYVLLDSEETVKCVVEMKSQNASLNDGERDQLKTYMKNVKAVWGILTNGTEFCFYIRDIQDALNEEEVNNFEYTDLSKNSDLIQVYTFSSLISELSEDVREDILEQYKRQEEFDVEEVRKELCNILEPQTEVEEELIDSFVSDFAYEIQNKAISIEHSKGTEMSTSDSIVQDNTAVNVQEDGSISLDDSESAAGQLRQVVRVLFKNDIITKSDVPYKIESHSRYLWNSEPVHPDGEDMRGPSEVVDGLFVECNKSTKRCEKDISSILDNF